MLPQWATKRRTDSGKGVESLSSISVMTEITAPTVSTVKHGRLSQIRLGTVSLTWSRMAYGDGRFEAPRTQGLEAPHPRRPSGSRVKLTLPADRCRSKSLRRSAPRCLSEQDLLCFLAHGRVGANGRAFLIGAQRRGPRLDDFEPAL